MRFRNSFHLLIDNFGIVYKMLLYKLIVGLCSIGLFFALIYPNISFILSGEEIGNIAELVKQFFVAITSGDSEFLRGFNDVFQAELNDLISLIASRPQNIIWSAVWFIFGIVVTRFLDTLGNFTFSRMINEKMNSYKDASFFDSFIKSMGKGSVYSICYVGITFLYDIIVIAACYFLFFSLVSSLSGVVSVFFSITVCFIMQAVKLTFMTNWTPAIIEGGLTNGKAFVYGLKSKVKYKSRMFSTYLISIYILVVLNVLFGVCTLFSGLLLTVPASFLFLICLQFVNYYTIEGKKYFVNHYKIAENKHKGENAFFYEEKGDDDIIK